MKIMRWKREKRVGKTEKDARNERESINSQGNRKEKMKNENDEKKREQEARNERRDGNKKENIKNENNDVK